MSNALDSRLHLPDPKSSSRIRLSLVRTYYPLIIGLLLVALLTFFSQYIAHRLAHNKTASSMNALMGSFYLVFALPKFTDIAGFRASFSQYDFIARRLRGYGYVYPFLEGGLGILFILGNLRAVPYMTLLATVAALIISSSTLLGATSALRQNRTLDCACLGSKLHFPLSVVAIVENGSMVVMALIMITQYLLMSGSGMSM